MEEGAVNQLCNRLQATELENKEIIVELESVEEVINRGKKCLLVKLLTNKYYNREAFKSTMKKIWRPVKPLCLSEIGDGLMMAEFEEYYDKLRVVCDGPWSFDKYLVLVKDFTGKQQVKTTRLTEATFWICIHDLPFMAHNRYIGRLIGSSLGSLVEVVIEEGGWWYGANI